MGRMIDTDDLVDAKEAAALFGFTHVPTFHALVRRRFDCPDPVIDKGKGRSRLWSKQDLLQWKEEYRPGSPDEEPRL